jgi:hypothetical protein
MSATLRRHGHSWERKRIDLVIMLEERSTDGVDRLGLEGRAREILGVPSEMLLVPGGSQYELHHQMAARSKLLDTAGLVDGARRKIDDRSSAARTKAGDGCSRAPRRRQCGHGFRKQCTPKLRKAPDLSSRACASRDGESGQGAARAGRGRR